MADARRVLALEQEMLKRYQLVTRRRLGGMRIRCHGDYHLGQVLYTGKDFVIIDFEGEPGRPLSERRLKRPPLRDVAGMLRSFQYAAYSALFEQVDQGIIHPDRFQAVEAWCRFWHRWVSAAFLRAYLEVTAGVPALAQPAEEMEVLLDAFVLEKAVYEIGYELNNRPHRVRIPLWGVLRACGGELDPGVLG